MKPPDRDRTLAAVRSRLEQLPEAEKAVRRTRMLAVIASVKEESNQDEVLAALDGLLSDDE
ncbi:MAG: hypothetical protein RL701_1439 [Pseudomonadota bacterium]|jgi:hypothetical protein